MFHVIWLPTEGAWAILFGHDIASALLLTLRERKAEAEELMDYLENAARATNSIDV
jgi:hypothetical protein